MTLSTSGKLFLCLFSGMVCIQSINGHFKWAPVWKPPKDKAYPICGEDLKDRERCKLPPWCPGGQGFCCRYECVCPPRYNPCLMLTSTTTASTTTKRHPMPSTRHPFPIR
ncbi:uncharacterized protein LOC119459657 isoform X2 [Dermacentor silvarum]|uniref:uncharacterized protein LOC119459657 isoform X1 n=1 Tax=Dermacentor silvarum TaxID=543639 RepID=UPI0021006CEB|nr:uncharacterized protein LOC119459657 isoform X1 [Dermacentor silvarum]XP_049527035.1 uncharacterized protein LOC119459657 isoform X2 [Dermacentor silvarum]